MNFFFLEYALACYFFSLSNILQEFFCVDGVEKVGIHYRCSLRSQSYLTHKGFDSRRVSVEGFASLSCGSTAELTIATPPPLAFPSQALPQPRRVRVGLVFNLLYLYW